MITYVNTVLVGKGTPSIVTADPTVADAGKYIIMNLDETVNKKYLAAADMASANEVKVGLITSKTVTYVDPATKLPVTAPIVKWSNNIKRADIKSFVVNTYAQDVKESVTIDFNQVDLSTVDDGGYNIILRITYKDLPTRYRKWTESYNYVTCQGDDAAAIATGFAKEFARNAKRNRVTVDQAALAQGKLILTAMEYDDDNAVDTINVAGQIRFNVNVYYTNPNGAGFTSKNKYSLNTTGSGKFIDKTVGKVYAASAKLVRDREAQAMGYEGILNRGEGTWPIIKPEMQTNLNGQYDALVLEFENMYRAADDIFRKTKQTLEIYDEGAATGDIATALKNFVKPDAITDQFITGEN